MNFTNSVSAKIGSRGKGLLMLLACLIVPVLGFSQQHWLQTGDFSGAERSNAVAVSLNGKAYVGTGKNSAANLSDWWAYDATSKSWTQKADFPGAARYGAVAFTAGNKIYVGTGYDGTTFYKDFYAYDPVADTWAPVSDLPAEARANAVAVSTGDAAYVGTGEGAGNSLADWWHYEPATDTWTQKTSLASDARKFALAFNLNDEIFVGGGLTFDNGYSQYTNNLYSYDPTTDSWTEESFAESHLARTGAATFVAGDTAYVVGGSGKTDTWKYVAATNEWIQGEDFGPAAEDNRNGAVGFAIDGKGYVLGGYYSPGIFDPEVYKKEVWKYFQEPVRMPEKPSLLRPDIYQVRYYDKIEVVWREKEDYEDGYLLYKDNVLLDSLPANTFSYVDTDVEGGARYSYYVKAYNEVGSASSYSYYFYTNDYLEAPFNLRAFAMSGSKLRLDWESYSSQEDGFIIELSAGTPDSFSEVGRIGKDTTRFYIDNLTAEQTYYLKVSTYNNDTTLRAASEHTIGIPVQMGSWKVFKREPVTYDLKNGFVIDNRIFALSDKSLYEVSTGTVEQKTFYPGASTDMEGMNIFTINGKAYFVGGFVSYNSGTHIYTQEVWEYDPDLDQWTQKNDFPGTSTGAAYTFTLNGTGYVAGGDKLRINYGGGEVSEVWAYDPVADSWTQKNDFPGPAKARGAAFVINSVAYAGLGDDSYSNSWRDFYKYDELADSWTRVSDIPFLHMGAKTIGADDQYGYLKGTEDNMVWKYDPVNDQWLPVSPLYSDYYQDAYNKSIQIATGFVDNGNPTVVCSRWEDGIQVYQAGGLSPVLDLQAEYFETDSVYLSWSDVNVSEEGYYVFYEEHYVRENGTSYLLHKDKLVAGTDATNIGIGDLNGKKKYFFYASAYSGSDVGQQGNKVKVVTDYVAIKEIPNLSLEVTNDNGEPVSGVLNATSDNLNLTHYIIEHSIDSAAFEVLDTMAVGESKSYSFDFEYKTVQFRAHFINPVAAGDFSDTLLLEYPFEPIVKRPILNVYEQQENVFAISSDIASNANAQYWILEYSLDESEYQLLDTLGYGQGAFSPATDFEVLSFRARFLNPLGEGPYSDTVSVEQYKPIEAVAVTEIEKGKLQVSFTPTSEVIKDYYVLIHSQFVYGGKDTLRINLPTGQTSTVIDLNQEYYKDFETHNCSIYGGLKGSQESFNANDYKLTKFVDVLYTLKAPDGLSFEYVETSGHYTRIRWNSVSVNEDYYAVSIKKEGEQEFVPYDTVSFSGPNVGVDKSYTFSNWEVQIKAVREDVNGIIWESAPLYGSYVGLILSGDESLSQSFELYPNPAQDQLKVSAPFQRAVYSLTDINGKKLLQGNMKQQTLIDVNQLPEGIYILQIESDGQVMTRRVVIER